MDNRQFYIKEFDKFIEGKNINSDDDFDNVFDEFMKQYIGCLPVERSATQLL